VTAYVVDVKFSVDTDFPKEEVRRLAEDILGPLADAHGVTLDEINVREGDGL